MNDTFCSLRTPCGGACRKSVYVPHAIHVCRDDRCTVCHSTAPGDTPYQPTGSGKWIWRKPLTRDVVEFGTLPDPRDARIAELEAALCEIRERIEKHIDRLSVQDVLIMRVVDAVLPRPPESDMTMTVEDLKL
jgi:hypothetical protein